MTARLRLRLFGGFDAQLAPGSTITLATKKGRALLAYLALSPGLSESREKLAGLLWEESSEQHARASLRQTLAALRRTLDGRTSRVLVTTGTAVALTSRAISVDVLEFERLVADGRPGALEQAATLYRGEILEGAGTGEPAFEEWLLAQRERLRELAVDALQRLLAHQCWKGSVQRAIQTAGRLVAIDPLEEGPHRALMTLYLRQGRRAAAVRQYRTCAALLKRDRGAEPEAETIELYRSMLDTPAPRVVRHRRRGQARDATVRAATAGLVGREAATTALGRGLDGAVQGQRQIAIVIGEAGAGRTRLMDWLVAESNRRGNRVLAGRASEFDRLVPFGIWLDVLRLDSIDTRLLGALDADVRMQLGTLFPELAQPGAEEPAAAPNPTRVFAALARLLERVSSDRPLTLVLEDLHWADEVSLGLVAFLARRLRECPILFVLTACQDRPGETLLRLFSRLEHDEQAMRIDLFPLARPAVAALVGALSPPQLSASELERRVEEVWGLSEGNAFVAIEAVRARTMTPVAETDEPSVPPRVRDMVMNRLAALSEVARDLLAVVAVSGVRLDFRLLARGTALPVHDAVKALDELIRHKLVSVDGEGVRMCHARVRRVVSDSLVAPRRQALLDALAVRLTPRAQAGRASSRRDLQPSPAPSNILGAPTA